MVQSSKLKACFPWQAPQDRPAFILSCVIVSAGAGALFPRIRKVRGWHVVQEPAAFEESTCMSWLKATTPGLSAPWGSVSFPGSPGRSAAGATPPIIRATSATPIRFAVVMASSPLGEEELPREVGPLLALELRADAEDRRAAVLQDPAELGAHPRGERLRRVLEEPPGGVVGDELPQIARQPRRLDLEEPAAAVRLRQRLGAGPHRVVHRDDRTFDGRQH